MRSFIPVLTVLVALGAGVATAAADEAKTPISASMILNIMAAPVSARGNGYDAAIKDPVVRPADTSAGEVQPDGSVRYGRAVVTVKNPCPPGEHFEPPMLPGRRKR